MGLCQSMPDDAQAETEEERQLKVEFPDMGIGGDFEKEYTLTSVLGSGAFSTVRMGVQRSTGDKFAVKCVTKSELTKDDREALLVEIDILKAMDHPGIIGFFDHFDEQKYHYLVLENMTGGELFDRIVAKKFYTEYEARECIKCILSALNYIHKGKIAHRDLKPENLLLATLENDNDVKIADFGFAKKCSGPNVLTTQCGTPGYVAPEILEGAKYDYSADMWSIGVIMYIIIGGYPPFYEDNQALLFKKIKKGDYEFHPEFWADISDDAKDLISRCITVNPKKRITCADAVQHAWMGRDKRILSGQDLTKNLQEFKRFNAKRKFKAGVRTVMAHNKMKSLMEGLRSAQTELEKEGA